MECQRSSTRPRFLGEQVPKGKVAIYARVSSADQRGRNKDLSSMLRAKGYKLLLSSVSFINLN